MEDVQARILKVEGEINDLKAKINEEEEKNTPNETRLTQWNERLTLWSQQLHDLRSEKAIYLQQQQQPSAQEGRSETWRSQYSSFNSCMHEETERFAWADGCVVRIQRYESPYEPPVRVTRCSSRVHKLAFSYTTPLMLAVSCVGSSDVNIWRERLESDSDDVEWVLVSTVSYSQNNSSTNVDVEANTTSLSSSINLHWHMYRPVLVVASRFGVYVHSSLSNETSNTVSLRVGNRHNHHDLLVCWLGDWFCYLAAGELSLYRWQDENIGEASSTMLLTHSGGRSRSMSVFNISSTEDNAGILGVFFDVSNSTYHGGVVGKSTWNNVIVSQSCNKTTLAMKDESLSATDDSDALSALFNISRPRNVNASASAVLCFISIDDNGIMAFLGESPLKGIAIPSPVAVDTYGNCFAMTSTVIDSDEPSITVYKWIASKEIVDASIMFHIEQRFERGDRILGIATLKKNRLCVLIGRGVDDLTSAITLSGPLAMTLFVKVIDYPNSNGPRVDLSMSFIKQQKNSGLDSVKTLTTSPATPFSLLLPDCSKLERSVIGDLISDFSNNDKSKQSPCADNDDNAVVSALNELRSWLSQRLDLIDDRLSSHHKRLCSLERRIDANMFDGVVHR